MREPTEAPGSVSPPVTASFVIRTLNEAAHLEECLRCIRAQQTSAEIEIVVVDSGSTDRTVAIAREHADILLEIRPEEFHYSRTLNTAIERSRGAFVVPLSGHSVIRGTDWLTKMLDSFRDPRVAGVTCRQVPWPDADWTEVRRIAKTFPERDRVWQREDANLFFSNAACCLRRDLWAQQPFEHAAAEDLYWARWALRAGYTIRYRADAEVYHSHRETPRQRARRSAVLALAHDQALGRRPGFATTLLRSLGFMRRNLLELARASYTYPERLRFGLQVLQEGFWLIVCMNAALPNRKATRQDSSSRDPAAGASRDPDAPPN